MSTIFLWMICTHFLHYSFILIYVSITTALPTFFLFLFRWIRIRPHSFFCLYWRLLTPSSVAWRFCLTVVIPFFIVLGGSPLCYPQVYSVLSGVEVLFFDGCHTVLYRLGWISAVLSPSLLRPQWRGGFIFWRLSYRSLSSWVDLRCVIPKFSPSSVAWRFYSACIGIDVMIDIAHFTFPVSFLFRWDLSCFYRAANPTSECLPLTTVFPFSISLVVGGP